MTSSPRPAPEEQNASTPSWKLGKKLLLLSLVLYLLDQATKWWIVLNMKPPVNGYTMDSFPVIEGFFNIVRVHNNGVAFGIGNGNTWASYVFLIVPVLALFILYKLLKKGFFSTALLRLSAALLFSGILGNLTDRLTQGFALPGASELGFWTNFSRGYVVDFIDVIVPFTNGYHWPSFNIADSCITIAAILLFIGSFTTPTTSGENKLAQK